MEFLGAILIAAVLIYGGLRVMNGQSTPGTFFSLMAALMMMYDPFKRINAANSTIQSAIGAAERVFELMDRYESIKYTEGDLTCDAKGKNIVYSHVYFKYPGSEYYVLNDIDLTIRSGKMVAIVGQQWLRQNHSCKPSSKIL